jgi:hypothetical protein
MTGLSIVTTGHEAAAERGVELDDGRSPSDESLSATVVSVDLRLPLNENIFGHEKFWTSVFRLPRCFVSTAHRG